MLLTLWLTLSTAIGDTVNVAVASNFSDTLRRLAPLFQQESGHSLKISPASTGKLYAQILHGAPFDVFLAADADRPRRLIASGHALEDTLLAYARGQLVLWQPSARPETGIDGELILREGRFRRLAIANPTTAPYGAAAREVLERLGIWQHLKSRIARGENISQTFQFVESGAADLGLVARPQLRSGDTEKGITWPVPQTLYSPIVQEGVVLRNRRHESAARLFMGFLGSPTAGAVIAEDGYLVGGEPK